jgi:flagellar protein FliS
MANTTLDRYLETEVLSADPIKLVRILYRGALEAIAAARRALVRKDDPGSIAERSRQIMKAWHIVNELRSSLDHDLGGDVARQLADLYVYIEERLIEGNVQQADAPLADADVLLTTLLEAWTGIPGAEAAPIAC